MATYYHLGNLRLRDGYSVDIEEENDTWIVYFNSRIHVDKRSRVGPAYGKTLTHEQILANVYPFIKARWGEDVNHCPHCGR